jgi:hypothetical protein
MVHVFKARESGLLGPNQSPKCSLFLAECAT